VSAGRSGGEQLLAWKSRFDFSYGGDVVAVSADNYCPVKTIIDSIFQKRQRKMDVGLFFLMAFPC
jgi:hypothetical protein